MTSENIKLNLNHPVHKHFEYSVTLNKSECKLCGESKKGKHSSNLLRHLKARHNRIYKEISADCAKFAIAKTNKTKSTKVVENGQKVTVTYDINDLTKSLACWITVDARPYSIVDDVGTRGLLRPVIDACAAAKIPFCINRQNLPEISKDFEAKFRAKISDEIKNKPISIQMDIQSDDDR